MRDDTRCRCATLQHSAGCTKIWGLLPPLWTNNIAHIAYCMTYRCNACVTPPRSCCERAVLCDKKQCTRAVSLSETPPPACPQCGGGNWPLDWTLLPLSGAFCQPDHRSPQRHPPLTAAFGVLYTRVWNRESSCEEHMGSRRCLHFLLRG